MTRISVDLNRVGIREVLSGLEFPAHRWQVIAQAQYYGATPEWIAELVTLPVRTYQNLRDVAGQLGEQRHGRSSLSPR